MLTHARGERLIYIITSAVTKHSIAVIVWSDILHQSEIPASLLQNRGRIIPTPTPQLYIDSVWM